MFWRKRAKGSCFDCGEMAKHHHHVVPKVMGGKATVPLCERCHGLVHSRTFLNHVNLTRKGLEKAKKKGVRLGRRRSIPVDVVDRIVAERASGRTLTAIADGLTSDGVPTAQGGARWHASTVRSVLAYEEVSNE